MADVQTAGDIRRRNDDREFRTIAIQAGREIAALLPEGIDALFEIRRLVSGGEFFFY